MKGQHQLFRVDDFGVVIHTRTEPSLPQPDVDDSLEALSLFTADSAIASQVTDAFSGAKLPGFQTSTIAAPGGRMTSEARDRYVFAQWDGSKMYMQTEAGEKLIPATSA